MSTANVVRVRWFDDDLVAPGVPCAPRPALPPVHGDTPCIGLPYIGPEVHGVCRCERNRRLNLQGGSRAGPCEVVDLGLPCWISSHVDSFFLCVMTNFRQGRDLYDKL